MKFRAAFVNMQAHLPMRAVSADVRRAGQVLADAIGFAEVGGRRKAAVMRTVLLALGYRMIRLKGSASAVPAAYRWRRWRAVQAFAFDLSPATEVGPRGAGPSTLREKQATVVHLIERRRRWRRRGGKRQQVIFIVCHLAPSLRFKVRSDLHRRQVARLANLITRLEHEYPDAEIVLVGDFNTSDRARFAPLIAAGLHLAAAVATHGKHAIDRCLSTFPASHARAVRGLNTDHDLLVVGLIKEES